VRFEKPDLLARAAEVRRVAQGSYQPGLEPRTFLDIGLRAGVGAIGERLARFALLEAWLQTLLLVRKRGATARGAEHE
jgi:hypothetical protein